MPLIMISLMRLEAKTLFFEIVPLEENPFDRRRLLLKHSWGEGGSKSHYSPTMGITAPQRPTFFTALRFINRVYSACANAHFREKKVFS